MNDATQGSIACLSTGAFPAMPKRRPFDSRRFPSRLGVGKQSVASLLGLLTPWLRGQGIAIGPPQTVATDTTAPSAPNLIADELAKLGQLRDTGVLSDEEFVALKTKLIEDHMGSGTLPRGRL